MPSNETMNVAAALATAWAEAGVPRLYGLPGGGSSLDLIEAAAARGIPFTLARSENAAVMMAGAMAETTGRPGVALTTKGPGLANAVNGVAYASLDRAPVMVVTDGFTAKQRGYITHQVFDQQAVLAPLVKGHSRLDGPDAGAEIRRLMTLASTPPFGPVHVELAGEAARRPLASPLPAVQPAAAAQGFPAASPDAIAEAGRMLRSARRPVLVVGLEARRSAAAVRRLAERLHCPVLPTYKAKGVVPDDHPLVTGVFTGGAQEQACVRQADLIVLVGLDPVELILQPWPYDAPVLDIGAVRYPVHYVEPTLAVHGDPAAVLDALLAADPGRGDWTDAAIATLRDDVLAALRYGPVARGIAPDRLVTLVADACRARGLHPRMAVDAGAHMFSATAFFPLRHPGDCLISNGLATMAFGLPAAIAASLEDPARPVVCFTGDGGLMMCLGELCTAADARANLIVIVFNDSALSLIDVKQQSRSLPPRGVHFGRHDFATIMRGAGGTGLVARDEAALRDAMATALTCGGPTLIDVEIDPGGYGRQLRAMRG